MKIKIKLFTHDFSKWSNPGLVDILSTLLGTKDPNKIMMLDSIDRSKLLRLGYDKKAKSDTLKNIYNYCKSNLERMPLNPDRFSNIGSAIFIQSSKSGYYYPSSNILMRSEDVPAPDKELKKLISLLDKLDPKVDASIIYSSSNSGKSLEVVIDGEYTKLSMIDEGNHYETVLTASARSKKLRNEDMYTKPYIYNPDNDFWFLSYELLENLIVR